MDKKNFEKDINVPSKRLDRIDKMEIELANYEQMERDIENIIEPYQLDWELDCLSLPSAIQSILERKEQECEALQMSENEAGEIIAELKAENDTLRQFLSKEPLALQALQSAYSSYKKSVDVFYEMVKQYKQTIAEIKEIAEVEIECKTYEIENDCFNETRCKALNEHIDFTKQILQKISEIEAEDAKHR